MSLLFCGASIEISGSQERSGCILLDRHEGPHKTLVNGVRDSSATRPEGALKGLKGRAVVTWFDQEPMATTCGPCHAKLHWVCHGEWKDSDGNHMCNCGCEAAA